MKGSMSEIFVMIEQMCILIVMMVMQMYMCNEMS